ncbi:RPA-interacting protein isoform X3 [Canis lupus familiaris]|uniref:RPA-interacting protein isoform X3 n=1 Tax=Canis lupus familiaris TaxID=9615 RepID=UPI0018F633EC|nr:RPA-interacting protein isoform X3 [Canis lupus familiaris]XP_038392408.1 RPA-interacting protein isoform X3 [Canis lupus familiaris]XP_038521131.1 RPA-interacting protein isoform X3 [Canis lupus familiaris]
MPPRPRILGVAPVRLRAGLADGTAVPRTPRGRARGEPANYNSQGPARPRGARLPGGDACREMAEAPGSGRRSLYKAVGSPRWKDAFRQGCLERMRNSRDRLLNRYRQAGGSVPRRAQSTLLVQEVMEEEWHALQSMERCPEALSQLEELMDLAVLEEIQQELADQERSILTEYEQSLQFDEECLRVMLAEWEANALVCPVCTKYNLRVSGGVAMCPCGLYLSSQSPELTEQTLRGCLERSVNEHSTHCPHTPEFLVTDGTEENSSLLMSCVGARRWWVKVT